MNAKIERYVTHLFLEVDFEENAVRPVLGFVRPDRVVPYAGTQASHLQGCLQPDIVDSLTSDRLEQFLCFREFRIDRQRLFERSDRFVLLSQLQIRLRGDHQGLGPVIAEAPGESLKSFFVEHSLFCEQ